MFAALLTTWGLCVVNHYIFKFGTGQHAKDPHLPPVSSNPHRALLHMTDCVRAQDPVAVTRELLISSATAWYTYQIIYTLALALIKFSILFFYLTIATTRTFRILVIISLVVVASFSVTFLFINAFECPKQPSLALTPGIFVNRDKMRCFELTRLYYSQAGINIFTDIWILILPMPILVKLRMPTLKRISL